MTDDELKKLRQQLIDDVNKYILASHMNASTARQSVSWGSSPTQLRNGTYQEPERDEQGTFYGYKVLHCGYNLDGEFTKFVSPRYHVIWENGECTSDIEPSENHIHGLHFTKSPDHPELKSYRGNFSGSIIYNWDDIRPAWALVKCALSGTIVETEQGFRAQHAQIIGVMINGHWQSYQDYQKCTRTNPRPNPYQDEYWNISVKKRDNGKPNEAWYIDWNP